MARNRIYFGILIFVLVTVIVWTSYSMLNVGKKEDFHSVSVIVNNSNDERWIVLRQGLEQAAKDYDIDLNYVSTGSFADMEEELSLARREIESGAEGLIIQMAFGAEYPKELPLGTDAAVVLLESDLPSEGFYTYVGPDNQALGSAVADAILEDYGANAGQLKIGVLAGNQRQYAMQQRLAGFKERIGEAGADVLWTIDSEEMQTKEGQEKVEMSSSLNIIAALGNAETEQLIDYRQEHEETGKEWLLYGVGCSEKTVYYLDKGMIQKLVVPNEFNMGYQSMEVMARQLKYHTNEAAVSQVGYLVVDKENLYDTENQKVLFPIVQ